MIRHYIFFLFLFYSIAAIGQDEKSIDSLIESKVYTGANIPAIRKSSGYATGNDGMLFHPDSVSISKL